MADDVVKIIKIETGGSEQTVKGLKDEINSLRDALLNTEKGSEEYKSILDQLIKDQEKLTEVMKAGTTQVSAATGSYNALVNQMSALKKAWKEATDEASRDQIGAQIKEINTKLKGFDASIGNFQRNVGDYANAIQSSFAAMGGAAKGMIGPINGVKAAFTSLSAHPLVAVLSALAALLIGGITKGFKSSEENTNKLRVAFSGLKAIGDVILKLFQGIASVVGNVALAFMNLADKLGLVTPKMKERQKLMEKQIELEKKERAAITQKAKIEKDAADLRAKAADEENYSITQRIEFLQQAQQKEEEQLQIEKDILQEKVNQLEAQLALTDSTGEELTKLEELKAQVLKVDSQIAASQRQANKEITALRRRNLQEQTQANQQRLALEKELIQQELELAADGSDEHLQLQKELRKKELDIQQAGFKQKFKNRKDYEQAMKLSMDAYNKDVIKLERQHARVEAEDRMQEYSNTLLKGLKEGSSKYYTALGDIANEQYKTEQKLGKQDGESDAKYKARLEAMRLEVQKYYDQGLQAAERETEVINQIILNSVRPMSAYYMEMYKQRKEYYENMQKLDSESDEEFAARQNEAWKKVLDVIPNITKALSDQLNAGYKFEDTLYNNFIGPLESLYDGLDRASEQIDIGLIGIRNAVTADIDNISNALIQKGQELKDAFGKDNYVLYGGIMPTPDVIEAIIKKDIDTLQELIPRLKDISQEQLISEGDLLFNNLIEQLATNDLVDMSVFDVYLEALRDTKDKQRDILDEWLDDFSALHDGISSIMGSVADIYEADLKAQVEHGKKSEEQAEQEFETIKGLRIAVAVIDTIQGALAAFCGWQDKGQPWGAIIGAVQAAAVTAAGIAQIAQIKNTKFGGSSNVSAGSTMMAQVTPVMTDYQPEMTGVMTGQQEAEELANAITSKPIRAYVVESDITNAQQTAQQRATESTF